MEQSTTEVEFIVAMGTVNQTLWLRKIFSNLHMKHKANTKIHADNQTARVISHNSMSYGKTNPTNDEIFFMRNVQKKEK